MSDPTTPTTDGLVPRLLAEIERLTARVEALEAEHQSTAAPTPRAEPAPRTRRELLRNAAGLAAGAGVAATLLQADPAAAADPNDLVRDTTNAGAAVTELHWTGASPHSGVVLLVQDGSASGTTATFPAAIGGWTTGAVGSIANGVHGKSSVASGSGVAGEATGTGGYGVRGLSDTGDGVLGQTTSGLGRAGVRGTQSGTGNGVKGHILNPSNISAAVHGFTVGAGAGVNGEAPNNGGLGGTFKGKRAAIHLSPQSYAGKPTGGAHLRGDLIVDKNGAMFLCIAGGTPGTWKRVQLV